MSSVCEAFVCELVRESMDNKKLLFEASLGGNVSSLLHLLREDPVILDRDIILNPSNETCLHIATLLGHLDLVKEILTRKPELATELNSRRSSPLHLASVKGYVEITKELILIQPDMCLARDRDGWNPLHLAAMKGRVDVLKELLRVRVHASRALVHKHGTILHLCVMHNQLEALKLLLERLSDHEFLNSKDDDGHTILHVAVADKQIETIKFLLHNTSIEVNEQNADGVTTMGILARSRRDVNDKEIMKILRRAGAFEENGNNLVAENHTKTLLTRDLALEYPTENKISHKRHEKQDKWLDKKRNTLMVVASLIGTMAFQVGVNPPGGVWQDTKDTHIAGYSIMADNYPDQYSRLLVLNTIGFISSLSIILLLISGLPLKRRIFMWILMVIMWIAVTAISFSFLFSIAAVTPDHQSKALVDVLVVVLLVWMGLMAILILAHTIRLIIKCIRKLRKLTFTKKKRAARVGMTFNM